MQKWQLQEAKAKFSELVKQSLHEFLSSSPLANAELHISRNSSTQLRDIVLSNGMVTKRLR